MSSLREPHLSSVAFSPLEGLSNGLALAQSEAELLARNRGRSVLAEAGHEFVQQGGMLDRPKLILSGWVGLARLVDDGRRQLADLHIAGDLTAFSLRSDTGAHASYVCLTPVRYVDVTEILEQVGAQPDVYPGLFSRMCSSAEDQTERLFEHIVRIGRLLAHERMAHFALDLYRRHERVGLCAAAGFAMPLTQDVLGDILGMSTVHVNRTLQQLRREGMLRTTGGRWEILDLELMQAVALGSHDRRNAALRNQM